jgi:dipeptidyl aminopeptidase/acylaminoacyl peptidase
VWRADGHDHIGVIDAGGDEVHWVHSGHLGADGVAVAGSTVALVAGSFTVAPHVVVDQVDAVLDAARAGVHIPLVVHRPPDDPGVDPTWLVEPEAVTVRSPDGVRVHALVYPPRNPDVAGPDVAGPDVAGPDVAGPGHTGGAGDLPPLLVLIHSGPTSAARPALAMGVQFWTSRGWVVAEVNYRGSTGYGRRYRNQLHHAWGVADVDDCIGVARWLADEGRVDPHRMVIRGGSAGGFTALGALAAGDTFAAAAVRYPVTDLAAMAAETHRFEAGYNDWLVADPNGQARAYAERSPVHHVADINVPVLVLQGADDVVVPAGQTAAFVDALRQRGVAVTHEVFEGEGHGFRHIDTLRRALAAEVAFFGGLSGGTSAS